MSFSKAKIHRFNDDKACAPPPGAYNPEIIAKTVGPVIHKTERFADNKSMVHSSSTESMSSVCSEKGDSSSGSFSTFKTPKVPSVHRPMYQTDVRRKVDFFQHKSISTECLNKTNSLPSYEVTSLKYRLSMVQEELSVEKNKTEQLLNELSELKQKPESDQLLESLIEVICEKDKLIDTLTEKCRMLQKISDESFESFNEHVKVMHYIVETYQQMLSTTENELGGILKRYEGQISEYEQDFETVLTFLVSLLQKQNDLTCENTENSDPSGQCNRLVERLKETERDRRLYEMTARERLKLIDVLTRRLRESDDEVEKMNRLVSTISEENTKLSTDMHEKDKEIFALCEVINQFTERMRNAEEALQKKVDELKEKSLAERKYYEESLANQSTVISELVSIKNEKEIQLQEALDRIEILKCKEEMLECMRNDSIEKCSKLESTLEDNRQQLAEWQKMCQENYVDRKLNGFCSQEKIENETISEFEVVKQKSSNESDTHTLAQKLIEFMSVKNLVRDVASRFDEVKNHEECMNLLEEVLMNSFAKECDENKTVFFRHLLSFFFSTFCKLKMENSGIKNDFARLQSDFIEKCDSCAELTRLLQLSEKHVEVSEKTTSELESCRHEWQMKYVKQQNEIQELRFEKLAVEKELSLEKARSEEKESKLASLTEELNCLRDAPPTTNSAANDRLLVLENSLKEERVKTETLEKQNSKLQKLIGPYRQLLEKYEAESKSSTQSDAELVQKYSKSLDQQNHKLKVKQIIKLRSDVTQLKKKNEELMVEVGKYRKNTLKGGKENKIFGKGKEKFEMKKPASEVPVNATYIITSPKVNRI